MDIFVLWIFLLGYIAYKSSATSTLSTINTIASSSTLSQTSTATPGTTRSKDYNTTTISTEKLNSTEPSTVTASTNNETNVSKFTTIHHQSDSTVNETMGITENMTTTINMTSLTTQHPITNFTTYLNTTMVDSSFEFRNQTTDRYNDTLTAMEKEKDLAGFPAYFLGILIGSACSVLLLLVVITIVCVRIKKRKKPGNENDYPVDSVLVTSDNENERQITKESVPITERISNSQNNYTVIDEEMFLKNRTSSLKQNSSTKLDESGDVTNETKCSSKEQICNHSNGSLKKSRKNTTDEIEMKVENGHTKTVDRTKEKEHLYAQSFKHKPSLKSNAIVNNDTTKDSKPKTSHELITDLDDDDDIYTNASSSMTRSVSQDSPTNSEKKADAENQDDTYVDASSTIKKDENKLLIEKREVNDESDDDIYNEAFSSLNNSFKDFNENRKLETSRDKKYSISEEEVDDNYYASAEVTETPNDEFDHDDDTYDIAFSPDVDKDILLETSTGNKSENRGELLTENIKNAIKTMPNTLNLQPRSSENKQSKSYQNKICKTDVQKDDIYDDASSVTDNEIDEVEQVKGDDDYDVALSDNKKFTIRNKSSKFSNSKYDVANLTKQQVDSTKKQNTFEAKEDHYVITESNGQELDKQSRRDSEANLPTDDEDIYHNDEVEVDDDEGENDDMYDYAMSSLQSDKSLSDIYDSTLESNYDTSELEFSRRRFRIVSRDDNYDHCELPTERENYEVVVLPDEKN